jgi:hypothetical protein
LPFASIAPGHGSILEPQGADVNTGAPHVICDQAVVAGAGNEAPALQGNLVAEVFSSGDVVLDALNLGYRT